MLTEHVIVWDGGGAASVKRAIRRGLDIAHRCSHADTVSLQVAIHTGGEILKRGHYASRIMPSFLTDLLLGRVSAAAARQPVSTVSGDNLS